MQDLGPFLWSALVGFAHFQGGCGCPRCNQTHTEPACSILLLLSCPGCVISTGAALLEGFSAYVDEGQCREKSLMVFHWLQEPWSSPEQGLTGLSPHHHIWIRAGWKEGSRSWFVELWLVCDWNHCPAMGTTSLPVPSLPCQPSVPVGSCNSSPREGLEFVECAGGEGPRALATNEVHEADYVAPVPHRANKSLGRDPSQGGSTLLSLSPGWEQSRDFVRLGAVPGAYFGS